MSSIPFHSSDKRPLSSSFLFTLYCILFMKQPMGKLLKGPKNTLFDKTYIFLMLMSDYYWDKFFSKMAKERKRKIESKEEIT